jgi:exopolysaccharide biosynthesis polyprenyl glycosylphosphotransferase
MSQEHFMRALHVEQKRTERSRRPFVLTLLESNAPLTGGVQEGLLERVVRALSVSKRETDEFGWYRDGSVVGVIFTEIPPAEGSSAAKVLLAKISAALSQALDSQQFSQLRLSCHVFPEDWHEHGSGGSPRSARHLELLRDSDPKKLALLIKASMDIVGSLCALATISPLLIAIAVAVKLTSKGPVFFRQQRVGQYGRPFTFLKIRSMYTANNHAVHQEYVERFIAGTNSPEEAPGRKPSAYKLTNDPRITPLGRFLRKTSLDELPQFINVLKGEMSLVGPRPPIPYEVECYDIWHKRRFLAVKPGITGLWQVNGRSRTTFNEMVRLDLKYGATWSLALDIKILLRTPRAILTGEGAY